VYFFYAENSENKMSTNVPTNWRAISDQDGFMPYAEGSALVCCGNTQVICTASGGRDRAAVFGWQRPGLADPAEYGMLPRQHAHAQAARCGEGQTGRPHGGIQRPDRRALRPALDLKKNRERTI